jgi:methylglyoxal synthase
MPTIALIAHDDKKDDLVEFIQRNLAVFTRCELLGTGTTGGRIHSETGLQVRRMLSGPLGGDAQIAALVAEKQIDAVIFILDPLNAHPHEPDIQGLLRVCNVHNVPLATNLATAQMILDTLVPT